MSRPICQICGEAIALGVYFVIDVEGFRFHKTCADQDGRGPANEFLIAHDEAGEVTPDMIRAIEDMQRNRDADSSTH